MSEINQIYVGENKEFFTIADTAARNQIANLDRVVVTPLPSHPQITTGDTIDTAFSKTEAQFDALGDMAFKDNLTKSDVTSALNYDPEAKDNEMKQSFQAGVDMMVTACRAKGSAPAGDPPYTPQAVRDAIMAIQTGGNYDTLDVSFVPEGTTYDAKDYPGIDAWNIVRVVPPEAPFTVKFFDDDRQTIIKTDADVPYKGSASCTLLDGTIKNGLYFKGWNPSPTIVTENMNCYPVRGDYTIDANEIHDSWETICADKGAHYPLGSYKPLVVTIPPYSFDYDFKAWNGSAFVNKKTPTFNISSVNISLHMVKVAEGEDNSVSTWISTGIIYIDGDLLNTNKWSAAFGLLDTDNTNYTSDWGNSAIRKYLNTHFLENLPESLKNNIVQVNKAYIGFANAPHVTSVYPSQVNKESLDKIWMLSKKELYTKVKDYSNITWWGGYEVDGIDYASVYVPTLSVYGTTQRSCLRTSANYNNQGKNYAIADSMGEPFNGNADLGGGSETYGKTMFGFCL